MLSSGAFRRAIRVGLVKKLSFRWLIEVCDDHGVLICVSKMMIKE